MAERLTPSGIVEQATQIAIKDLVGNYGERGTYAGRNYHEEYWGRDIGMSILGSLALGHFDQCRKNLDLLLQYQRNDGLVPTRVEERNHAVYVSTGIKIKTPLRPIYQSSTPWSNEVADTNPLTIIMAKEYSVVSGDFEWFSENKEKINKAGEFLLKKRSKNGLIEQGLIADWADMTLRNGNVTYTNVLAWKALDSLGWITEAAELKRSINDHLWDPQRGHFINFLGTKGYRDRRFYSDGNLLAIGLDFTTRQQSEKILDFIDSNKLGVLPVATYYKENIKDSFIKMEEMYIKSLFPNYKPENIFGWWGPWLAIARHKTGNFEGAIRDLETLSECVVRNGNTHEVLDSNGIPIHLKGHFKEYRSEKGPSMAAAPHIHLTNIINGKLELSKG